MCILHQGGICRKSSCLRWPACFSAEPALAWVVPRSSHAADVAALLVTSLHETQSSSAQVPHPLGSPTERHPCSSRTRNTHSVCPLGLCMGQGHNIAALASGRESVVSVFSCYSFRRVLSAVEVPSCVGVTKTATGAGRAGGCKRD